MDPGGDFDQYAVYRGTAPFTDVGGMTPIVVYYSINQTEHLDTTTVNGTSYWYAVTTVSNAGQEETSVGAIGPRTPFDSYDLQVVSISRTPHYPRYCPEYTLHEITETSGFGPYYCSAATSLGCGQDEFTQRGPNSGDSVTYTATVRNRGTQTIYDSVDGNWLVDGSPHDSANEMLFLEPGDQAAFSTQLTWDGLSHEVQFDLGFLDDRPQNNSLAIDTKSVAFYSCIERSRLEVFREDTVNYPQAETDDFIDWLNLHMARLNQMFAAGGSSKRVHYDQLPVISDNEPDPAIDRIEFAIFPFRFATGDGNLRTSGYYQAAEDRDYGLFHEWGHQLGLIDLYRLNLEPGLNQVNGEAYRVADSLMMNCAPMISQHSARAMDSWLDEAHGYFGQYLYNLPEQVKLRLTDQLGDALINAQVKVYQKVEQPGVGEILSNQVKFTGQTDDQGEWTLPNVEIDPLLVPQVPTGEILSANPFGYVQVTGNNGLFLLEVEYDGLVDYAWLDIMEVNNAYWSGQTETAVIERQLGFASFMHRLPEELTELNAGQWSGHCEIAGEVVLTDDLSSVMVGNGSIRYETDGAYDTWMRFPGSGNASWNMRDLQGFQFWVFAENPNIGFQNQSPWIILNCEGGSYEYHATSDLLNSAIGNWVQAMVPATGNAGWAVTVTGTPDLSKVHSIEFHADTWNDSFTLWIDGFIFDLGISAVDQEVPRPVTLVLGQNFPNPFNPRTRIDFHLEKPGQVRLVVYNAAGEKVRILAEGIFPEGKQSVIWDGLDDGGRQQVSGVYFYRLETGNRVVGRKMLLLK